jgi:hypothetical protein
MFNRDTIIAILVFPLVLLALVIFYAILGVVVFCQTIYDTIRHLDFSGNSKKLP